LIKKAKFNTDGLNNVATGSLLDSQRAYYKVVVPTHVNGTPVLGCQLDLSQSSGQASMRVRKDLLPSDAVTGMPSTPNAAVLAAPFLTNGTWFVEVRATNSTTFTLVTIILSILIGGVTFTGSMIAYGKLSERIGSGAVLFSGQQVVNSLIVLGILAGSVMFCLQPANHFWLYLVVALSLVFGVMAVIPIGGADMPVVISLLNSYSGLAACAAGFAVNNNILIVAGALVGASGIILTQIMCKAMNRSLANVLFSGFGSGKVEQTAVEGEIKPISAEDAYYILEAASNVAIIPGYGMAVAQAQHVVKELAEMLERNGCEVNFGIHPVAGRMPGHMNVLLAEADVPYEQLLEMDDINPRMENVDVAIVIGANDVVNPAARENEGSPIYGMPVINVDKARTVFVLKRSMASGFAGIENPLFYKDNTRMLFGDAKESIGNLVREFSV